MWACWCDRRKCNLRCQSDNKHSLWYKILSVLWPTPWKQGIWRMVSGTVTDRTDYLQVGMGAMLSVCAVATQGENINNEKTTSCNYPQTVKPGTFMRKPALQRFNQQLLVMIRGPQRVQFRGLQKRISKFASQREVCKPCFSTIAARSALKVHTIQIILFYIGKQRNKCR